MPSNVNENFISDVSNQAKLTLGEYERRFRYAPSVRLTDDDGNSCWTYGNSQKAVNLAVKYLVHIAKAAREIGTEDETSRIGEVFLAIEKDLDIPVDSRIIKASQSHNEKEAKKLILPLSSKNGSGKVICWSKWEKSDYEAYSRSLHEAFERPFEWEERVWIRRG